MGEDDQPLADVQQVPPQCQFDQDLLAHNLQQARAAYAGAKLGCTAARAGISTQDGMTQDQHASNLEGARKVLSFAESMIRSTAGGEILEPLASVLTIVDRIPGGHPSGQGPA